MNIDEHVYADFKESMSLSAVWLAMSLSTMPRSNCQLGSPVVHNPVPQPRAAALHNNLRGISGNQCYQGDQR
jgi:hypothetical protein